MDRKAKKHLRKMIKMDLFYVLDMIEEQFDRGNNHFRVGRHIYKTEAAFKYTIHA